MWCFIPKGYVSLIPKGYANLARLVCTEKFQTKETAWSFNLEVMHGTSNPTKYKSKMLEITKN